jgi:DNA-binding FadR family transcriptional regulator
MLLSQERVVETVQARELIEGEFAAQAARRQDAAAIGAIGAIGAQPEIMDRVTAEDPFGAQAYPAADVDFRLAIARAARNAVLQELMMALLQSFIARNLQFEGRQAARIATLHHRAISQSIRRGVAPAARRATVQRIETYGRRWWPCCGRQRRSLSRSARCRRERRG